MITSLERYVGYETSITLAIKALPSGKTIQELHLGPVLLPKEKRRELLISFGQKRNRPDVVFQHACFSPLEMKLPSVSRRPMRLELQTSLTNFEKGFCEEDAK